MGREGGGIVCEQRSEVFLKIQKKRIGAGVGSELRSEAFVKIKKKSGLGVRGCQGGSEQRIEREGGGSGHL